MLMETDKQHEEREVDYHVCPLIIVTFDIDLDIREMDYFRYAIIEAAGKENILFHNHLSENAYRYGYPLIQYRWVRGKPAIVALASGTEGVVEFFNKWQGRLRIKDDVRNVAVHKVYVRNWIFSVGEEVRNKYFLRKWLPFNEENYTRWKESSDADKDSLMRKILIGNILSMAKGIGWKILKQIDVNIYYVSLPKTVLFKRKVPLVSFNVFFKTNVRLPHFIGLGKGVSRGFGSVLPVKD